MVLKNNIICVLFEDCKETGKQDPALLDLLSSETLQYTK